jgi:hypothetical protein
LSQPPVRISALNLARFIVRLEEDVVELERLLTDATVACQPEEEAAEAWGGWGTLIWLASLCASAA